jgi:hypothetical protein
MLPTPVKRQLDRTAKIGWQFLVIMQTVFFVSL